MPAIDSNLLLYLAIGFAAVGLFAAILAFSRKKRPLEIREAATPSETIAPTETPPALGKNSLSDGLSRTRGSLLGRVGKFFTRSSSDALGTAEWDEIEEALLEGDVGITTSAALIGRVKEKLKMGGPRPLKDLIQEEAEQLIGDVAHGMPALDTLPKPYVVSIVGVNGVGKTTTIGKLAHHFQSRGKTVLMGAGDTFRAAAISQLKIWADRSGAQFVTGREGGDPGAVAFDSLAAAKARGVDVVLLDTAGRLHTKTNLMEELKKVHRVMKKVIPEAPHETWLVVDGTLGQNSLNQAREFMKMLTLTGIVVTKLDGTSKGGAILSIASELQLPIRFIGIGETMEDLIPFEPKPFIGAILGTA